MVRLCIFEAVRKDVPKLALNEVLTQLISRGLCHSDLPTYFDQSAMSEDKHGNYYMEKDFTYPRVCSHKSIGRVIDIESDVKNLKSGNVGDPMSTMVASYIIT